MPRIGPPSSTVASSTLACLTLVLLAAMPSISPPSARPPAGITPTPDRASIPSDLGVPNIATGHAPGLSVHPASRLREIATTHPIGGTSTSSVEVRDDGLLRPYHSPPLAFEVVLHVDPKEVTMGETVSLQAIESGGTPPLYYTWYDLPESSFLPTGCSPRDGPTIFCDPAAPGVYRISTVITDALGLQAMANATLSVFPPALSVSVSANPDPSAPGQSVQLTAAVSGGVGPYRFQWTGLPPGCAGSTPSVACSPRSSGEFPVNVTVLDLSGESATSGLTIVVVSPKVLSPLPPTIGIAGPGILLAGLISAATIAGIWWATRHRLPAPWRGPAQTAGAGSTNAPSVRPWRSVGRVV